MHEAIKKFSEQFRYEPRIENEDRLFRAKKFVVCGMGGSHLAAGLLSAWKPELDIVIHRDYGLPWLTDERERLVILSSYSGNTEEVLDAWREAGSRGLHCAAIAKGGKLIELARTENIAYVQMPDTGIQPRSALGFSIKALLAFLGETQALENLSKLAKTLRPLEYEEQGKLLAQKLKDRVPVIYSSTRNFPIAYNWKIKFNETGKIPAFYNVLPELNHNEMNGFDIKGASKHLSERFHFLLLRDPADDARIQKRMDVLEKLYRERNLPASVIPLEGEDIFFKMFSSLLWGDWTALYTAEQYGLESEQVPMIEEFKKLIAGTI